MPLQPYTLRSSRRQSDSSFNAFGHDPNGRVVHLAQHLFGQWAPHVIHKARFSGRHCAPPRFGPPTGNQISWLPVTFVPRNPPLYHGIPCAPYLPPPVAYDPMAFSELVSCPQRYQTGAIKLLEEELALVEAMPGVWRFKVLYWSGSVVYEFLIRTNLDWTLFQRLARIYLGIIDLEGRIGYRIIRGGVAESLYHMRGESDWKYVMGGIQTAAAQGHHEAMEIHYLERMRNLLNTSLQVETYYFTYPSVDDLLHALDDTTMSSGTPFINADGRQGLRIAGMLSVDDFTMVSPVELALISHIWPEKVNAIFFHANEMIVALHNQKRSDVNDIVAYRQQFRYLG